jgi:hypothetical protein
MGVTGAGDVFRRCAEFHGDGSLADHVTGIGADDMLGLVLTAFGFFAPHALPLVAVT